MTYIVWINDNEQWLRSPELDNLDAVLAHVVANAYGHEYEVTKKVDVQLIEKPKPMGIAAPMSGQLMGSVGAGMAAPAESYDDVARRQEDLQTKHQWPVR